MTSLPLPLAHVLADEDARLFGDDAPRDRRWILHDDEIVDARALAQKIADRMPSAPENIARWREESGHDPAYRTRIVKEINDLLESIAPAKWLFEHEAFADAEKAPYSGLRPATRFDPDDVFNLNREIFDGLFRDEVRSAADVHFAELVKRIHARAKKGTLRTAIAISGGGIRSATYALGVLQGLAKRHVLEKFDFLSTISGGGYIGGWLSSWVRRDPWGIRGVCSLLASEPSDPLEPEPMPLRHLRAYSSYLIPRLSLFSADTWALIATYLRNVLLNWIVLIPLLAGMLSVPRFVFSAIARDPSGSVSLAVTSKGALAGLIIGMLLLSFGFGTLVRYRPAMASRKVKNLTDGKFVTWILLPLLGAAVAFTLAWAWHVHSGGKPIGLACFLGAALLATTLGFFVFVWNVLKQQFADKPMDAASREKRQSNRLLAELGASVASGVVGGLFAWLAATVIFPEPVQALSKVGVVRWPITDPGGLTDVTAAYVCFAVPLLLAVFFLQAVVFVGAASHHNHDFDREWWARASGWVLLSALLWIGLSALAIFGPVAIYHLPGVLTAAGGAAGIFSVLAGRSGKTKGSGDASEESTSSKIMGFGIALAVPVFVLFILALISLGITEMLSPILGVERVSSGTIALESRYAANATREYPALIANKPAKVKEVPLSNPERVKSYEHLHVVASTPWRIALALALGLPLLALLVSRCIGVNVFSMHAMYRDRLVRAYLGASRWNRDPNKFTGFDPQDNLSMHDLRPEYLWRHSFRDIDNAIGLIANARMPRLRLIHDELRRQLGSEIDKLFDPETDRGIARPAFYQSLNVLIASRDLAFLHDPTVQPERDTRRALRNRRFIEVAFGDSEIYPSPNPLICSQDIRVTDEDFRSAFKPGTAAADALRKLFPHGEAPLLQQINAVIAEGSLKDDAAFAKIGDTAPFLFSDVDPIHRMIDNRLRIEAAFELLLEPLRLARPMHIIGICLNLTAGEDLAWQERKGESFTVTPLAAGSPWLGYRDARKYGDISVGTAVTISGAAASPNMGYHSSPALAFLMTLFNVRLGWWLGNPGVAGNDTYERRNPKVSISPLVRELTGNSNDKYEYVYLSDGGHFENLGLYEMVLRRVHRIVVTDGTGDPEFVYGDLGNAIRKIRIDLGVEIEITEIGILPPSEAGPGKYCAYGDIKYTGVDGPLAEDGKLLYIKPVVYKNQGPRDVLNYSTVSKTFPHESTADQFFSESQFESYRRLGAFTVDEICRDRGDAPMRDVDDFIEAARQYLHPVPVNEKI